MALATGTPKIDQSTVAYFPAFDIFTDFSYATARLVAGEQVTFKARRPRMAIRVQIPATKGGALHFNPHFCWAWSEATAREPVDAEGPDLFGEAVDDLDAGQVALVHGAVEGLPGEGLLVDRAVGIAIEEAAELVLELVDALDALYSYVYDVPTSTMRAAARLRAEAMDLSDAWVATGCEIDNPLLAQQRRTLVASFTALRDSVERHKGDR